jgi:hypothetical protein
MFHSRIREAFPWKDVERLVAERWRQFNIPPAPLQKGECIPPIPLEMGNSVRLERKRIGNLLSSGESYRVRCSLLVKERPVHVGELLVKRSPYAELEYQWLREVYPRLAGGPIQGTVPEPIGLLISERVVITDFFGGSRNYQQALVTGSMLRLVPKFNLGTRCLRLGTRRREELIRIAGRTGSWLGSFHAAMYDGTRDLLEAECPEATKRIEEIPFFTTAEKSRIMDAIVSASKQLGPVPVVVSHGDFAPRNVLFREDRVMVTDWEMVHERKRSFLFDMIHFLVALSKFGSLPGARATARACEDAFVKAYESSTPFQAEMASCLRPTRLVVLVTVLSRQFRSVRRQPVRGWVTGKRGFMRHLVEEIRHELGTQENRRA